MLPSVPLLPRAPALATVWLGPPSSNFHQSPRLATEGLTSRVESSLTEYPSSTATGASLTALTIRLAVSVATENAVMPPLAVVSALPPLLPLVRSQARKVMALACVPL